MADAVFGGYQVHASPTAYQRAATRPSRTASSALTRPDEAGFNRLSLPILQPAAPFIDRMGPEMQRRLFPFTDPGGQQPCLRPDFTIPTALAPIAPGRETQRPYCDPGPAVR